MTLFYTSTSGQRYPVNYRVYEQGGAQTKNELFREMLTEVLSWGLCPSVVSGDSWYSSKDNLRWIRRQGLDAFFAVEKDRIISINKGEHQQIQQASITTEGLWTHLKGFDFVTAFKKEQANQTRYQNLRTLTLRKVLSDHFSLNNISELIPIINVALIYSFF